MPAFRVSCPHCGAASKITDASPAPAVVRCRACGERFRLGSVESESEENRPREDHARRSTPDEEDRGSSDDQLERRPRRRKRRKEKKSRVLLWVLGGAGGVVLVIVLACAGLLYSVFGPEASLSAVPLKEARAGFQTRLIPNSFEADGPAAEPPPHIYHMIRYPSPAGNLVAYLTPDPRDGKKHPAMVWAHGGFGGIGDFQWKDDGDTLAFRQAGLIVMCPSWRGENDNPGKYEMFYGEVDDAVAAVEYVSRLPYVDPSRIYMGGHSTGGTVTLLTVEMTDKLRAAFPFGGAPDIGNVVRLGGYGNTPFNVSDKKERRLRSAIDFVSFIRTPTFYFEGATASGYLTDARKMEAWARKAGAPVTVNLVAGGDHFNILRPVSALIAEKIRADTGPRCNISISADEVASAFGSMRRRG